MMSLFSSFDLSFFKIIFIIFLMFFFFNKNFNFWLTNKMKFSILNLKKFLMTFFYSLKEKEFDKFALNSAFLSFLFIYTMNSFGILPFFFPLTSQLSVVIYFSLILWISTIFFQVKNNFKNLFIHLVPTGSPMILVPFLFLIEVVSSIIRPLTLTVRLCANITAGHLLMILLCKLIFIFKLSFFMLILLNLTEIFVSLIQSYIFSTLICLYYSEVK